MGLLEDLSKFLETRLEEFLQSNPHLELQALEDKLREQEDEAVRLLADLRLREKSLQAEILETAQDVQRWHVRIEKAKNAGRQDLATPAEEREAALLRHGNQLWGQMELVKQRVQQTLELQQQVKTKLREVQAKVAEAEAARASAKYSPPNSGQAGWSQTYSPYGGGRDLSDPLEQAFSRWEMDDELNELKRNMKR